MSAGTCWDDVGTAWASRCPYPLWREHTDRLQVALLDRWLDGPACQRFRPQPAALKTDLFDEVAGKGIVHHLLARGFRVSGIDISAVVATTAGQRNPDLEAIVADIRDLPFPNDSFDVVFSGSTLDHFGTADDIGQSMQEIARVLRPAGILVLTLDNPRNPLVRLRNGPLLRLLYRCGIVPYPVGVTLGPAALTTLAHECGLEVLRVSAMLHCPRVFAVWLAGLLQGRRRSTQEWFLEALACWERLDRWPSRWATGYFTTLLAVKPDGSTHAPPALLLPQDPHRG